MIIEIIFLVCMVILGVYINSKRNKRLREYVRRNNERNL